MSQEHAHLDEIDLGGIYLGGIYLDEICLDEICLDEIYIKEDSVNEICLNKAWLDIFSTIKYTSWRMQPSVGIVNGVAVEKIQLGK